MARVLGALRESGADEESVSLVNQEKRIRQWADDHGHTVVHITSDKATSGGTPARERESLGPWLRDYDKLDQWDILACAKLDRGFRSVLDFAATQEWAKCQGKSVASVAEGYDFSTPEGSLMAIQLVAFAEFERKRGGVRRGEAKEYKRDNGFWDGGRLPYGYEPVGSRGNWRLAPGKTAPVVLRMVEDAIAGKSLSGIAAALNAEGIPSPLGRSWRDSAVRRILTSPALMGHTVKMIGAGKKHKNIIATRYDRDGQPILFTDEPLITPERFAELQRALESRARSRGAPQARHLLWDVAFCVQCSGKLYGHRHVKHATYRNYYACRNCSGVTGRLEDLDTRMERFVLAQWGGRVLEKLEIIQGDDHAAEIRRLLAKAERWRADLADEHDPDVAAALAKLEGRIAQLRATREPDQPKWVPVESGETVAAYWERSDTTARNTLLRLSGFRMAIGTEGEPVIQRGHPSQITDGLVIPHAPGDHEDLYQVAGVNVVRDEDGTLTLVQ